MMMLFSSVDGPISRSGRKKSACLENLWFNIWNIFFVNVLSGSVLTQLNVLFSPGLIPSQLARAVPTQATFFIIYVLSSGWASLSSKLTQLFALTWNFVRRYVFKIKTPVHYVTSFPYHTEVPRVLVFWLIGFTCSVLAPLILPFLLVYFFLAYVVYRDQNSAGKVYKKFVRLRPIAFDQICRPMKYRCGLCGGTSNSLQLYRNEYDLTTAKTDLDLADSSRKEKVNFSGDPYSHSVYGMMEFGAKLSQPTPLTPWHRIHVTRTGVKLLKSALSTSNGRCFRQQQLAVILT